MKKGYIVGEYIIVAFFFLILFVGVVDRVILVTSEELTLAEDFKSCESAERIFKELVDNKQEVGAYGISGGDSTVDYNSTKWLIDNKNLADYNNDTSRTDQFQLSYEIKGFDVQSAYSSPRADIEYAGRASPVAQIWLDGTKTTNDTIVHNVIGIGSAKATSATPVGNGLLSGLEYHYNYEANSGSTVDDSTGQYDGTLTYVGTPWEAIGIIDYGYDFTGGNDWLDVGGTISSDDYAVSQWMYPTDISAGWGAFFAQGDLYSSGAWIGVGTSGQIRVHTGGGGQYCDTAVGVIVEDQWQHVVVSSEGGTGVIIYVDGAAVACSQTGSINSLTDTSIDAQISGKSGAATHNAWDGYLDESMAWDRTVSAAEVTALYNSGGALAYSSFETPNNVYLHIEMVLPNATKIYDVGDSTCTHSGTGDSVTYTQKSYGTVVTYDSLIGNDCDRRYISYTTDDTTHSDWGNKWTRYGDNFQTINDIQKNNNLIFIRDISFRNEDLSKDYPIYLGNDTLVKATWGAPLTRGCEYKRLYKFEANDSFNINQSVFTEEREVNITRNFIGEVKIISE